MGSVFFQEVTNKDHFKFWADNFIQKPLISRISFKDFSIRDFFSFLEGPEKVLLESSKAEEHNYFSIIGVRPSDFFAVRGSKVSSKSGTRESSAHIHELKERIEEWNQPSLEGLCDLPITGGAIGFFSYEASRFFSPIQFPTLNKSSESFFDYALWFYDTIFVVDHRKNELFLCATAFDYSAAHEKMIFFAEECGNFLQKYKKREKDNEL